MRRLAFVASGVLAVDLSYYSRDSCIDKGYLPKWSDAGYQPYTHFEKLMKSPLTIDLMAAAHSGQESGFEQVTADWGCAFDPSANGFYGPGAKDPAGGGCPKGPVKVYEDLVCAIRLGLNGDEKAFQDFCGGGEVAGEGMFECLSFFAHVITETGSFAETEERDPRPYCWNREEGNSECCPASDHKPCLPDSENALEPGDYPTDNELWLTDKPKDGKCCSYHGRGFLQVSYEPNYKALSKALTGDMNELWERPYKLDSDGVMGWTAALWYWFNEHAAQVGEGQGLSPRNELYKWREGKGFPSSINIINGAECSGEMDRSKPRARISYLLAIAHRLEAEPPLTQYDDQKIKRYPLPGTAECEMLSFCRNQFHNNDSDCGIMKEGLSCVTESPYIQNISTPIGWDRRAIKMTAKDGHTSLCEFGASLGTTPDIWNEPQESLEVIDKWWTMLDVHRDNVCDIVKQKYVEGGKIVEGRSDICSSMCYHEFAWEVKDRDKPCDTPQKPCTTMGYYLSSPTPWSDYEGEEGLGDYFGGEYFGRAGPGLVKAMNGPRGFGDRTDSLCYIYGGTACHWNIAMGCSADAPRNIHGCRVYHPEGNDESVDETVRNPPLPPGLEGVEQITELGQVPTKFAEVLEYYDAANCPELDGKSVLEQILPKGEMDMDMLFSIHYSQSDGFSNKRYDNFSDLSANKVNVDFGSKGPKHVWESMMCAYKLGIPEDPKKFQKYFGRMVQQDTDKELTEEEKKFAKLEFIAFAANIIKETGALSQSEEQDPRCYCNNEGGSGNKCCPNEWGNNAACPSIGDSENSKITAEQMAFGTTPLAKCCSYHGRGALQTSYEKNYGDLGATMFASSKHGVDADLGRRFLLNYPQVIDAFSITGWTASFIFWLEDHPCKYCEGNDVAESEWNAPRYSPHIAMTKFDQPGYGLGMTFNIINGQECEAAITEETDISWLGAQMRLSIFYSLAHRLNVVAPGETGILPLPGTKECDASPWCQGTFMENKDMTGGYREHAGGCWALTPQPVAGGDVWTHCTQNHRIVGSSKYAAMIETVSFTIQRQAPGSCTLQHAYKCGAKIIDPKNKPSMMTDETMSIYTDWQKPSDDYDDEEFMKVVGMDIDTLCEFTIDKNPGNNSPAGAQDCRWWCLQNSGARSCNRQNPDTCMLAASGLNFVKCANDFFAQGGPNLMDCMIDISGDAPPTLPETSSTTTGPEDLDKCQRTCSKCVSIKGGSNEDRNCKICAWGSSAEVWPCYLDDYCKCAAHDTKRECDADCDECIGVSGSSEDARACKKCANGNNLVEWPCQTPNYCKCKA